MQVAENFHLPRSSQRTRRLKIFELFFRALPDAPVRVLL